MDIYYYFYLLLYLPMLTAISVYRYSTVSFHCTLTPTENDTLIWEYTTNDFKLHRVVGLGTQKSGVYARNSRFSITKQNSTTILTIAGVKVEDEGYYKCSPFQENSLLLWSLEVYILPEEPVIVQEFDADEGEMYTIECRVQGGKPTPKFRWSLISESGKSLDFTHTSRDTLVSTNSNGTGNASARLGVIISRQMQGASVICNTFQSGLEEYYNMTTQAIISKARYTPCVPTVNYTDTLTEGWDHEMQCIVGCADPPANITWSILFKSGEEQLLNNSTQKLFYSGVSYKTKSQLYIHATRDMHGGLLQCSAVNDVVLRQQLSPPAASVTLGVHYRPVMTIFDTILYAEEGGNLMISCQVTDANPPVTAISWLHESSAVDTQQEPYSSDYNHSTVVLIISNISRSDEGRWQCEGLNRVGGGKSNPVLVHVLYKPVCMVAMATLYQAQPGERIEISCSIMAKPAEVQFYWKKADVPLNISSTINKSGAYTVLSTIHLQPRLQSDYGIYECYAENVIGLQESPCIIQLSISGSADIPTGCQVTSSTLHSLVVNCMSPTDSGSVISYTLKMQQEESYSVIANESLPAFHVTGLKENSTYTFIVCASNYEFWRKESCTGSILGMTAARYILNAGGAALTSPLPNFLRGLAPETLYIILATLCISLVVVAALLTGCYCFRRSKRPSDASGSIQDDAMQF